ncbi:MAG: hypothetical protein H6719_25615 [Sandaracinaceae bacterium]|nr:hypothetical protein [Sandaracinaceae bacterium]
MRCTSILIALALAGCGDSPGAVDAGSPSLDAATRDAGASGSDAGEAAVDAGPGADASLADAGPDLDDAGGGPTVVPVRPSAGCGATSGPTGALTDQTTSVDGVDRGYDLFVPEPYDPARPHPVVFTYHGVGGSSNTNQFNFDRFSEAEGGATIQVAPQGWTAPEWAETHFVPFNLEASLTVFDQVLAHLAANYCIDLNRVFAMGMSNGGQMAFHLGCLRGDAIRAIVPSGGRCFSYGPGVCDPDHPPSAQCVGEVMVLSVMGEDDTTRHADEEATIEGFRARQGCSTTVEPRSPAPCQRFVGCEAGGEVASCRIPGLGHQIWRDGRRDLYDYLLSI